LNGVIDLANDPEIPHTGIGHWSRATFEAQTLAQTFWHDLNIYLAKLINVV